MSLPTIHSKGITSGAVQQYTVHPLTYSSSLPIAGISMKPDANIQLARGHC